jgi:archaellum biogenesis ATPase FlaH
VLDILGHILEPHIVRDAFYNAWVRQETYATTCHPDTRIRIMSQIEKWTSDTQRSVCWLHGPAGAGKSIIASTIAEHLQGNRLAATFFFSRSKGAREDITNLIPTLAYQISQNVPSTRPQMVEVLREDPTLLSRTMMHQFLKLIVEPFENIDASEPFLIIIDGLDECPARDRVLELIRLLGETLAAGNHPLNFLLTSRPEVDIEAAFRIYITGGLSFWLSLEDSKDDVRTYLRYSLTRLRQKHAQIMANEPLEWPSAEDLEDLVRRSEGLFIFAATCVHYMEDERESLQVKLRQILSLHNGMDPLYNQVMSEAQQCENFDLVMGTLMYLRQPLSIRGLAWLLRLDVSDIRKALDRCHSVLVIPDNEDDSVRPYHASLRDFLTNKERSWQYFLAPAKFHALIAIECLRTITDSLTGEEAPPKYACMAWYYHCSSLLSEANTSQDFRSLCRQVEAAMKTINPIWVKHWMVETLAWAGVRYVQQVELPSSKVSRHPLNGIISATLLLQGLPAEARALHIKLKRIARTLDVRNIYLEEA